ncbi:hypothetical protein LCGC14_2664630, partial [marine sediment metagenome]
QVISNMREVANSRPNYGFCVFLIAFLAGEVVRSQLSIHYNMANYPGQAGAISDIGRLLWGGLDGVYRAIEFFVLVACLSSISNKTASASIKESFINAFERFRLVLWLSPIMIVFSLVNILGYIVLSGQNEPSVKLIVFFRINRVRLDRS